MVLIAGDFGIPRAVIQVFLNRSGILCRIQRLLYGI